MDTFQIAFGKHRPADYADAEWDATPTRAHNVALHILATQGLTGGATAATLVVGLALAAVRAWRRSAPADRPTIAAVAAGLAAFLVQDLFGFTVIGCGSLFVTGAALLSRWAAGPQEDSPQRHKEHKEERQRRQIQGFEAVAPRNPPSSLCFLCVLCVFVVNLLALYTLVVRPVQAEIARGAGDRVVAAAPAEALACYRARRRTRPGRRPRLDAAERRGPTRLTAGGRAGGARAAPGAGCAALGRAVALAPAAPYHHADFGRLLGEMAACGLTPSDAAIVEWDAALAGDPRNAVFLAEAARTALGVGRRDRARAWAARGLELYPQYALLYDLQGACDLADGRLDESAAALDRALHSDWHGDDEDLTRALATFAAVQLEARAVRVRPPAGRRGVPSCARLACGASAPGPCPDRSGPRR